MLRQAIYYQLFTNHLWAPYNVKQSILLSFTLGQAILGFLSEFLLRQASYCQLLANS
jgi:hypothetical protein